MDEKKLKEYGGERPFFAKKDLTLEDIRIVDGESGLKECSNITIRNCAFNLNSAEIIIGTYNIKILI